MASAARLTPSFRSSLVQLQLGSVGCRRLLYNHSQLSSAGPVRAAGIAWSRESSSWRVPKSTSNQSRGLRSQWSNQRLGLGLRVNLQARCLSNGASGNDNAGEAKSALAKPAELLRRLTPLPHENIYTLPNILTFSRLLAAPAIGYFILTSQPLYALGLFVYAGLTDAVDGWLARRYNSQTVVGTVIDPMADKTLMTVAVVCLSLQGALPVWLAVIVLGRDVGLAISAIYFRWISLPPPKTMARYWDFSLPSAEVHPTEISKINTLLQLLLVGCAMTLPVLSASLVASYNLGGVVEGFQYLVAGTTVWSGLSYVWSKDAVKILTKEEIDQKMEEGREKAMAAQAAAPPIAKQ